MITTGALGGAPLGRGKRTVRWPYLAAAMGYLGNIGRLGSRLGTAPPVTVYIRGPIKGYIYNHIMIIIQLLLSGGSTQGLGCAQG